jgi:hypothetical protein
VRTVVSPSGGTTSNPTLAATCVVGSEPVRARAKSEVVRWRHAPSFCAKSHPDSECNKAQEILDQVGTKYGISCQVNYERLDYNRATHAHCSVSEY